MSEQPKENEGESEPRITYVGIHVSTEPIKKKNPNRVAAIKSKLHYVKKRLLKEGYTSEKDSEGESNCENSAINVAYIAGIFGIVTRAIAVYKWFYTEKCEKVPNPEPEPEIVHHRVERVADESVSERNITYLD